MKLTPGVALRIRWLPKSPTKIFPLVSMANPQGVLNAAPVPVPSANAVVPLPASVVTANCAAQRANANSTSKARSAVAPRRRPAHTRLEKRMRGSAMARSVNIEAQGARSGSFSRCRSGTSNSTRGSDS